MGKILTDSELAHRRTQARASRLHIALGDPAGWRCSEEPVYFYGGRECAACSRRCYHAFALTRLTGPAAGVVVYLGTRCALSAFAFVTGGLKRNGNGENGNGGRHG